MYYIRKYSDGWAIHNDRTGNSRLLTFYECEKVISEFPELEDKRVATVYADDVKSIDKP